MRQCPNCLAPISWGEKTALDHRGDCTLVYCDSTCQSEYLAKQSRKRGPPINRIMLAVLVALAAIMGLVWAAGAEPPPGADPALILWFQSLNDRAGQSCCGMGDYHAVNYRGTPQGGLQLQWKGVWYDVPEVAQVENFTNPTGAGAAFFYEDSEGKPIHIYCLVRAVEG